MYRGVVAKDGKITGAYDGSACYDEHGKCICAQCYHEGPEATGCVTAGDFEGTVPIQWVQDHWEVL